MKIHLDIRDDIPPTIALECVKQVVEEGRISAQGQMYVSDVHQLQHALRLCEIDKDKEIEL